MLTGQARDITRENQLVIVSKRNLKLEQQRFFLLPALFSVDYAVGVFLTLTEQIIFLPL